MWNDRTGGADVLRRHPWALVTAAGGSLAAWLFVADVVPRLAEAVQVWTEWREDRARLTGVAAWEVEETNIRARRLYLQQHFESLYVSLPHSEQISVILQALQRYAGEFEVRLEQVRQGERVGHPTFDELPVDVELLGTFHGIGAFVDQIERSQYLMKVSAIEVEAVPEPRPVLSARIRLLVIILRERQL